MIENKSDRVSFFQRLRRILLQKPNSKEDLLFLIQKAYEYQLIDQGELTMIEGVIQVSHLQVREIMIPRAQMVCIEEKSDLETILKTVIESGHSRFPVIDSDHEEIVGILLAKDLLTHQNEGENFSLHSLVRPRVIVPESKRLDTLLDEFQRNRNHMAIVIDEYGQIAGLVTIEDVLEQIVGDIEDESDIDEENFIVTQKDASYRLKAITPIEEFNQFFGTDWEGEFDTIGGLLLHELGYLPKKGEKISLGDFEFTVLHADDRRIRLLHAHRKTHPSKKV